MLAKLFSLVVLVWFYKTAKDRSENAIQWAVIGFIGFWLMAAIGHFVITKPLLAVFHDSWNLAALIRQIPAFVGLAVAWLVRKKYLTGKTED